MKVFMPRGSHHDPTLSLVTSDPPAVTSQRRTTVWRLLMLTRVIVQQHSWHRCPVGALKRSHAPSCDLDRGLGWAYSE
ncbi:hypothetical protein NL676_008427 [Syzygium grande]|nr:hypothetical protein NL676_008427 [Syzygium grande]